LQVAVIIPLSGPVAQYGQAVRRGIELAQLEQKKEIGAPNSAVHFTFYDNAFSVAQSVSTLHSLLSTKARRPDVVISIDATHGNALRPICENAGIVHLSASSDPRTSANAQFTIRTWSDGVAEGAQLASTVKRHPRQKIAILFTPSDYHEALSHGFSNAIASEVPLQLFEIPAYSQSTLASLALRLKSSQTTTVLLLLHPGMIADFARRASEIAYIPSYLSGLQLEAQSEWQGVEALSQTQYVTRSYTDEFYCLFQNEYGSTDLLSLAALHFDLTNMLDELPPAASAQDRRDQILSYTNPNGASGAVRFVRDDVQQYIVPAIRIRTPQQRQQCE
jgi:ABC-type branched-subunit amino acid transport system substrate-binding protein